MNRIIVRVAVVASILVTVYAIQSADGVQTSSVSEAAAEEEDRRIKRHRLPYYASLCK